MKPKSISSKMSFLYSNLGFLYPKNLNETTRNFSELPDQERFLTIKLGITDTTDRN